MRLDSWVASGYAIFTPTTNSALTSLRGQSSFYLRYDILSFLFHISKYRIQATEDHPDASSEILAIYEQIGRNQPSASMYQELSVTQLNLTQILSETYKDVIEVNR